MPAAAPADPAELDAHRTGTSVLPGRCIAAGAPCCAATNAWDRTRDTAVGSTAARARCAMRGEAACTSMLNGRCGSAAEAITWRWTTPRHSAGAARLSMASFRWGHCDRASADNLELRTWILVFFAFCHTTQAPPAGAGAGEQAQRGVAATRLRRQRRRFLGSRGHKTGRTGSACSHGEHCAATNKERRYLFWNNAEPSRPTPLFLWSRRSTSGPSRVRFPSSERASSPLRLSFHRG